jgi:hypothetical protein
MALSKSWTAQRLWAEAVRDLSLVNVVHGERFMLINRAQNAIASSIPTLWSVYMTRATKTLSGDVVSLSSLNINQAALLKTELESSATKYIEAVSTLALKTFRPDAIQNRNKIVYAISGNQLFLAKGSNLNSYGTLTLRFVRMPDQVSADSDFIDIPDGAAMEMCLLKLKEILRERYGLQKTDDSAKRDELMRQLYESVGQAVSLETDGEKAKTIL